jgi:hypothetical protein
MTPPKRGPPDDDAPHFGPVPADLLELWIFIVSTMEQASLGPFMRRIRATRPASEIEPLEAAVVARQKELHARDIANRTGAERRA